MRPVLKRWPEKRPQCACTADTCYTVWVRDDGSRRARRCTWCSGCHTIRAAFAKAAAEEKAPKLGYGEKSPTGERWITVHPHGKDEDGYPVLIKENPDGSHTVIGGAGGALTGLRLTGVKSHKEYREEAQRRRQEKLAAKREQQEGLHKERYERHLKDVQGEGMDGEQAALEAQRRSLVEAQGLKAQQAERVQDLRKEQKAAVSEVLEKLAPALGWKQEDYTLSEEKKAELKAQALEQARERERERALQRAGVDSVSELTPKQVEAMERRAQARAERQTAQVEQKHQEAIIARIRQAAQSAKERVVNAHDELAADQLGDVALGDLVHSTMGDSGKGYLASLNERAAERGVTAEEIAAEKEEIRERRALEQGKDPAAAAAALARMQEAAARAREEQRALQAQAGIETLPTALGADASHLDVGQAISVVQAARQLGAIEQEVRQAKKEIEDTVEIDRLPTTAVLQVSPISDEEALQKVVQDLAETKRQTAARALVETVHNLEADAPIREHRLSGHSALFSEVSQLVLGGTGVDPVVADVLGESGTAHVLARAMREGLDDQGLAAAQRALVRQHVETQAEAAAAAVEAAEEHLNAAENLEIVPLTDEVSLLAALHQNSEREELVREARRLAGTALGRLEAAAALNEALMGEPGETLQVSLGTVSYEDAIIRARAIGLEQPAQLEADGDGGYRQKEPGDYVIHSDGRNKFLEITEEGMAKLSRALQVPAEEALLRKRVLGIQRGAEDEIGWLPEGISRRPKPPSFAYDPEAPSPVPDIQIGPWDGKEEIVAAIRETAGRMVEAGYDALAIQGDIRARLLAETQGANPQTIAKALEETLPIYSGATSGKGFGQAAKEHDEKLRTQIAQYHQEWVDSQVKAGVLDAAEASIHHQTLPDDPALQDLAYQVVTRDPRLQYAFAAVGDLGREGRQAVREYALRKVFQVNPKEDLPVGITGAMIPAWQRWREVSEEWAEKGGIYRAIQEHWREVDQAKAGPMAALMGGGEAHAFATLDLSDDQAVVDVARQHWSELGYLVERIPDPEVWGKFEEVVPALQVGEKRTLQAVAGSARNRIKRALREHFLRGMVPVGGAFGSDDGETLAEKGFNPENVVTATKQWGAYVKGMGEGETGEVRAYSTILEKMRGDVVGQLAAGYERSTGTKLRTIAAKLGHAEEHARLTLSHEALMRLRSERASAAASARTRARGKFAEEEEGIAGLIDAALAAQRQQQGSMFGETEGRTQEMQLDVSRLTMGKAAEAQLASLLPRLDITRPAPASDADMSTGEAIKRQRFLKQFDAAKRVGNSLGVGGGKTLAAIAGYTMQRAKGKVERALFAVPSAVQGQFAAEAVRFVDPTAGVTWHAKPGASKAERQAAYAGDVGMVVVTHQALRDDLIEALAEHRFDGDTKQAAQFLRASAPSERNAAMQAAAKAKGWNFGMTVVDEGHTLLDRSGKDTSAMAAAIDGITSGTEYHMSMSADPVKNDVSEAWSFLNKVRPDLYHEGNREAFLRRYARGGDAGHRALALEMAPHHYAESLDPGVKALQQEHVLKPGKEEQAAYTQVHQLYRRARAARQRGEVDVEAIRELSPGSFEGAAAERHQEIAERLSPSLGMLRNAALDRVVNTHPESAKLKEALALAGTPEQTREKPLVIFAHRLEAVKAITDALKAAGHRVVAFTGADSSKKKTASREGFAPTGGVAEPEYDVMVASDAGAVGLNLQRAKRILHYDTPYTAMTHEQRKGRAVRWGQTEDVDVRVLRTDTPYERRRHQILSGKMGLRQMLTRPSELIDDTGLADRIAQEEEALLQAHMRKAAA